ncbi:MAG: hypothetical protein AAF108_09560 [Planctomycetota bacterium]
MDTSRHSEHEPTLRLVGSAPHGSGNADRAQRVATGGLYQPDRLAADQPPAFATEPETDGPETDGGRLFRRLLIALGLIIALVFGNAIMLRHFGVGLGPEILFSAFAVIAIAGVLTGLQRRDDEHSADERDADSRRSEPSRSEPEGCAVGLCPGPRPPRFLRK